MTQNIQDFSGKSDTIAAICTGPGGAIAIIRISGPDAYSVASRVWVGKKGFPKKPERVLHFGHILSLDGETCLAAYMPGPKSYTGEDVVEIQLHSGNFAPLRALDAVLQAGARSAEPGEFTKRAFLNGKIDLTQAEAVLDLIQQKTSAAGKLAEKQMNGALGNSIRKIRKEIIHDLAEMESKLDFSEEDLDFVPNDKIADNISRFISEISVMINSSSAGNIIRNGIKLVLAGSPNSGKSSLLNALLGYDRAIVSPIPGTTRDTVEENLSVHGILYRITDTAGLHENSNDPIENIGIGKTRKTLETAEIILWLMDSSNPEEMEKDITQMKKEVPEHIPCIVCFNKTDLISAEQIKHFPALPGNFASVHISALMKYGLSELLQAIENAIWKNTNKGESDFAVSERHKQLLQNAEDTLIDAKKELLENHIEIAAACLHQTLTELGSVTGETIRPDLLDEIFSRFCIGK